MVPPRSGNRFVNGHRSICASDFAGAAISPPALHLHVLNAASAVRLQILAPGCQSDFSLTDDSDSSCKFAAHQSCRVVTTLFDRVLSVERRKGQFKAFHDMVCWPIVAGGTDRFGMATRGGRIVIWRCSPRR